jgi:hypothetical protein
VTGIGQSLAQVVQQVAQVGARLGFGGVRPKMERELLPGDRLPLVQQQIRQQGLQARRVETAQGLSILQYPKIPQ